MKNSHLIGEDQTIANLKGITKNEANSKLGISSKEFEEVHFFLLFFYNVF